jgi:DNA-binding transcriptional LysR family regulator
MSNIGFVYMAPSQLRALHLVVESGSFSAVARDSGLSQPNLSGQVTALEKAYGIRPFDRRGRSVVPTGTGRQLQGITSRLLAIQEEAQALLDREQTLTHGHLRIAADPAHHVVPTMAALKKRAGSLAFALSDNELVPGSITPEVLEQAMAAADIRPRSIVDVQTRGVCARRWPGSGWPERRCNKIVKFIFSPGGEA